MGKIVRRMLIITAVIVAVHSPASVSSAAKKACVEEHQMVPVTLQFIYDGKERCKNKAYPASALRAFVTVRNLLDDCDGVPTEDNRLVLPINTHYVEDFRYLLDLVKNKKEKLPASVNTPQHLIALFNLAKFLDPDEHYKDVYYPLTIALLEYIQQKKSEPKAEQDAFAQAVGQDISMLTIDTFSDLIAECSSEDVDDEKIRDGLRVILATDYLKKEVSNTAAQKIVQGVKCRAAKMYNDKKLIDRIRRYVFNNPNAEEKFPLVAGIGQKPTPGYFPLSVQDLVNADLFNPFSFYTNEVSLHNQGLTSLDGLLEQVGDQQSDLYNKYRSATVVSLANNYITRLPKGFCSYFPAVQNLYLRHNKLTVLPKDLFEGVPEGTLIEGLYLDNNPFCVKEDGSALTVDEVKNAYPLITIDRIIV